MNQTRQDRPCSRHALAPVAAPPVWIEPLGSRFQAIAAAAGSKRRPVVPANSSPFFNFCRDPLSNASGASMLGQMSQRPDASLCSTPREHIADCIIHVTGLAVGIAAVVIMMVVALVSLPPGSTAS